MSLTVVMVHGNPETEAVWEPLLAELQHDHVVRLSPPGFGAAVPPGFGATMLEYRDWLVTQMEAFEEPVDLVGHDWGAAHVMNAVMARPDLVRSWAVDGIAVFDPDYTWHPFAQSWADPTTGEDAVAGLVGGTVEERTSGMIRLGIPQPVAGQLAAAQGEEMGRAVLSLYRSAVQPAMLEAGRHLEVAAARPGLAVWATGDELMGTEEMRRRSADRAGARSVVLEGSGHWWMLEELARGARVLNDFWAGLS